MPFRTDTSEPHKIKLASEILRAGGSIHLRVLGMSMLPAVWPGDVVTVDGLGVDATVCGDIVLYQNDDRFFVHRLVEKPESPKFTKSEDRLRLITRGDAMPHRDPKITRSQFLGRVSSIQRNGRTIFLKSKWVPLMRVTGWMLCYCDTARSVALRLHAFRTRQRSEFPIHSAHSL
jgi:signal peptidase